MVAAYAFALQALLGAVLVSQAAAAGSDPFVICYASDAGNTTCSIRFRSARSC